MFPKFLLSKKPNLSFEIVDRIKSTITNIPNNEEEKAVMTQRLLAILSYWGDCTLDTSKKGYLGAINVNVFAEFGLSSFVEKILGYKVDGNGAEGITDSGYNDEGGNTEPPGRKLISTPIPEPKSVFNKAFEDFAKILSEWHYDKKSFTKAFK